MIIRRTGSAKSQNKTVSKETRFPWFSFLLFMALFPALGLAWFQNDRISELEMSMIDQKSLVVDQAHLRGENSRLLEENNRLRLSLLETRKDPIVTKAKKPVKKKVETVKAVAMDSSKDKPQSLTLNNKPKKKPKIIEVSFDEN